MSHLKLADPNSKSGRYGGGTRQLSELVYEHTYVYKNTYATGKIEFVVNIVTTTYASLSDCTGTSTYQYYFTNIDPILNPQPQPQPQPQPILASTAPSLPKTKPRLNPYALKLIRATDIAGCLTAGGIVWAVPITQDTTAQDVMDTLAPEDCIKQLPEDYSQIMVQEAIQDFFKMYIPDVAFQPFMDADEPGYAFFALQKSTAVCAIKNIFKK